MKPIILQTTPDENDAHIFNDEGNVRVAVMYMNTNQPLPEGKPWKLRREPNKIFTVMGLTADNKLVFLKRNMNTSLPFMK